MKWDTTMCLLRVKEESFIVEICQDHNNLSSSARFYVSNPHHSSHIQVILNLLIG